MAFAVPNGRAEDGFGASRPYIHTVSKNAPLYFDNNFVIF